MYRLSNFSSAGSIGNRSSCILRSRSTSGTIKPALYVVKVKGNAFAPNLFSRCGICIILLISVFNSFLLRSKSSARFITFMKQRWSFYFVVLLLLSLVYQTCPFAQTRDSARRELAPDQAEDEDDL